jgi:hypothetical protein
MEEIKKKKHLILTTMMKENYDYISCYNNCGDCEKEEHDLCNNICKKANIIDNNEFREICFELLKIGELKGTRCPQFQNFIITPEGMLAVDTKKYIKDMEKIELLKSIANSQHLEYPLHNDLPIEELRLAHELESEGYLHYEYHAHYKGLKPTEKGMKAIKFDSFKEYELSLLQRKPIAYTVTNNITAGIAKVENNPNINSPQTEHKKENLFGKIITWLVALFKIQL